MIPYWTPPWEVSRNVMEHREGYARAIWRDAALYLAMHGGGPISNQDLSRALGCDPRGLRQVLMRRPEFICELRANTTDGRGVPYFKINPEAVRQPPDPAHREILAIINGASSVSLDSKTEGKQNERLIDHDSAHIKDQAIREKPQEE